MTKSRKSAPSIDLFADDPIVSSPSPAATLEVMESEPAPTPEVTPQVAPEVAAKAASSSLAVVLKDNQLEGESALFLTMTFEPMLKQVAEWSAKVGKLIKPGVEPTKSEHEEIKKARLALRKVRTTAEKSKDALKAEGIRRNAAIQGAYNIVKFLTEPLEEQLLAAEQFAERKEEARKDALAKQRATEVAPFTQGGDTSFYNFREMPDDIYENLVVNLRTVHEAKIAAAAKAEADRLAKEKAEQEERDRVRAENERLRKEAAEREKALADERAKVAREKAAADALIVKERADAEAKAKAERDRLAAESAKKLAEEREKARAAADAAALAAKQAKDAADAVALKERQAREKAEAEVVKVKAAEAKRVADEAAAKKRAAKAPEKERVRAFAAQVAAVPIPTLTTPEGIALRAVIVSQMGKLAAWLETEAEKL